MALLLTTGTNLLGIFTVPFLICTLLGTGDIAAALNPVALLASLIKSILVPLMLGAAARASLPGKFCRCTGAHKHPGALLELSSVQALRALWTPTRGCCPS